MPAAEIPDRHPLHRNKPYTRTPSGPSPSRGYYHMIPSQLWSWSKYFAPPPTDALPSNALSPMYPQSTPLHHPQLRPMDNPLAEPYVNADSLSLIPNNLYGQFTNGAEGENPRHPGLTEFGFDVDYPPSASVSLGQTSNADAGPSGYYNSDQSTAPSSEGGIFHHQDSGNNWIYAEQPAGQLFNAEAGPSRYYDSDYLGGISQYQDSDNGRGYAEQPLSIPEQFATQSLDSKVGPPQSEEEGSKDEDVKKTKVVSFSKLSARDCPRLGLKISSEPISETVAKFRMAREAEVKERSMTSELALSIAQISCSANDNLEAFSRKIIDQFALSMHKLVKKMDLATYEVVEFRIASAEDPIEILREDFLTVLTGSVDYTFFFRLGWSLTGLKTVCDTHHSLGVQAILRVMRLKKLQIFLLEAKSKEYSSCLATCMPQMGAECIATMISSKQRYMAWCLSTGSTWIFGVIYRNTQNEYEMRMIRPMEFQLSAADKDPNLAVVHDILWALTCWTLVPAEKIFKKVFSA